MAVTLECDAMPQPDLEYLFVVTYGRSGSTLLMGRAQHAARLPDPRREPRRAAPPLPLRHDDAHRERPADRSGSCASRRTRSSASPASRGSGRSASSAGSPPTPCCGRRRTPGSPASRRSAGTTRTSRSTSRGCARSSPAPGSWSTPATTRTCSRASGGPRATTSPSTSPTSSSRILALADSLGDAAYRVHYDDYVADPTVLRGMFDWLGEEFDEATVRATMAVRHCI